MGLRRHALSQLALNTTLSLAGIIGCFAAAEPLSSCGVRSGRLSDWTKDVALMRYERSLRQGTFGPPEEEQELQHEKASLRIRPSETVRVAVLGLALPRCRSDNPHFNGVSVILWLELTREPETDLSFCSTKSLPSAPQDYPASTSSFCGVITFPSAQLIRD